MPRTTVTNKQLMQTLVELRQQIQQRDEPLEARLDEVTVTLADVARRMDRLERSVDAAMTKEAKRDTCPFRDEIVAGANKDRRLAAVEKGVEDVRVAIHQVELRIAGWGALGGGAISAIVAVADRVLEALGVGGGGA